MRCLENAFRRFGGVPKAIIPDNLKAAVLQADWFDPQINPKLTDFAAHYGTVILPTKPRTPQHKGKVEAGVKYVQNNALKGRSFGSLAEQNQYLDHWEARVADKRIHGTVRQQVEALFEKQERPALQPLPVEIFPSFHEAKRSVYRDGYVEYKKAYYSVPPEHVGREVWVRGDSKLLHIYTLLRRQIAVHTLVEAGRFATDQTHVHPHIRNAIERGARICWNAANSSGRTAARGRKRCTRTAVRSACVCSKDCCIWLVAIPPTTSNKPARRPAVTGAGDCGTCVA